MEIKKKEPLLKIIKMRLRRIKVKDVVESDDAWLILQFRLLELNDVDKISQFFAKDSLTFSFFLFRMIAST